MILVSGIGLFLLIILAASISSIEFKSGQEISSIVTNPEYTDLPITRTSWWTYLCLTMILVMFPLGIILLIFSSEARKYFKKNMKVVAIWLGFLILWQLFSSKNDALISNQLEYMPPTPQTIEVPTSMGSEINTPETFSPPILPNWQAYMIGFTLVFFIGLIIYLFWVWNQPKDPLLEEIALKTLREINAGQQWEDAVIQCYAQMIMTVRRKRGLNRDISMTPGEFVEGLEQAGIPSIPTRKLTTLFEKARYSDRSSNKNEANEAMECLSAIVQALEVVK